EREDAMAALAAACEAARCGDGRVAVITGEPGIGKTALVAGFLEQLDAEARVLVGTCDDLTIPRPLGAVRDLVGTAASPLEEALSSGAPPHEIHTLLLAELERPPAPTVLVLEDVHWADHATLDAITVLGRRIGSLPALLVLTFRTGEVAPGHPLHAALGAVRAANATFVELEPLSDRAVAALAGADGEEIYAQTRGNPFYVTELLASPSDGVLPPSVATAVRGRMSRLDDDARGLIELVSVVPNRVPTALLDGARPGWLRAAEEPERRGLLEVDAHFVRFRHELARNAILSSVPVAVRRRLHAEILGALLAAAADPAEIVHHAEAAGDEDVVAEYALVAARRAAALESNREAYSHYLRASDFGRRLPLPEQAELLEELVAVAYRVGKLEEAFPAIERAIAIHAELGDEEAVGRCTRMLSRLHLFAGNGALARTTVHEAIAILEPLGDSVELARAYATRAQLAMGGEEIEDALEHAERALGLAAAFGDDATRVQALVTMGTARIQLDPGETSALLEAHAQADAAGERHEATRALGNLAYALQSWFQPARSRQAAERALAYAQEHEVHALARYIAMMIAYLDVREGHWERAERAARAELGTGATIAQLLVKRILADVAVRRGDADAPDRIADLTAQVERTGELQRMAVALELEAEWALTTGAPMPTDRFRALLATIRPPVSWGGIRIGAWAAVAGLDVELEPPVSSPHAAMLRRDWLGAADVYGDAGWRYDRALMLSLVDGEEQLLEALGIARSLGAKPLTGRLVRRLRELGYRVPQGPRRQTRANPAGLTQRQLEVLALLVEGLTNAEIAQRLFLSPRTAEHHVKAVLEKIGAETRREATARATDLGLELPLRT
ncbi:MAG TPA: AAA family ATPase, partial [Gaiellaceae bacterium]|nr:AAA family ATPase [Gaiellaceae bacterium]